VAAIFWSFSGTASPSDACISPAGSGRSGSSTSRCCQSTAEPVSAAPSLKDILAEGVRNGKRVSIHVEMFNPALALYERLGFRKQREIGVYHFMEWSPESSA
jgi:hypothetical protein